MIATAADRFTGAAGASRLLEAFLRQRIVGGDKNLAVALAGIAQVQLLRSGQTLIQEGASDTDVYFVLLGELSILRGGRPGRIRSAGECVGEMAALDVHALRSATVVARDEVVVAKVTQAKFAEIADAHPSLWRALALLIINRLQQRLQDIQPRNEIPRVFIGSSVEGLAVADAIQAGLAHENAIVQIWKEGVFGGSRTTIESLEKAVRASDFAILVLSPDDALTSRGKAHAAPRDNVIFELGLFMGALGRHRTFSVAERGLEIKAPTDLLGIYPLQYEKPRNSDDLASKLGPVCTELRKLIAEQGPK